MGQDVVKFHTHGFTYLVPLGNSGHSGTPTTGRKELCENGLPDLAKNVPNMSINISSITLSP